MSRELNWSELADQDVEEILEHLESKWGSNSAINFLNRVEESLIAVQNDPETYLEVDKTRHIHKFIVNKYITLYYRVSITSIDLITFWSNRKDDFVLKKLLKKPDSDTLK